MTQLYEHHYASIVEKILYNGKPKNGRNGKTVGLFGMHLSFECKASIIPLLQARRMYPAGVLGEFAALIRGPKHIDDFKKWGCNYWDMWAKEDGSIEVDYGNAWWANGQMDRLIDTLKNNPDDRRMLISGWRPERLDELDLPCCHYMYQFYVRDGVYLDMMWMQRSVDVMIGLPSDMLFAALWLRLLANQVGLIAGRVVMSLGDCHIYEEHLPGARAYIDALQDMTNMHMPAPIMTLSIPPGMPQECFEPSMATISYTSMDPIKFELKA